jgi:hypothetical protein
MSFMAFKAIAGRPIDRLNIRGCLCLGLLVGRRPDRIKRVEHIPHNVHVQPSMRVPSFHRQLAALQQIGLKTLRTPTATLPLADAASSRKDARKSLLCRAKRLNPQHKAPHWNGKISNFPVFPQTARIRIRA